MKNIYTLVGILILPRQWSKYLIIDKDGKHNLIYEHNLHNLCLEGKVKNCESYLPEKKSYDDYTVYRKLITHPINLLEVNSVRITIGEWVSNKREQYIKDAIDRLLHYYNLRLAS